MGTAAIRIHSAEEFFNPNVVKVVADKNGSALYFSRAPIPWDRDGFAKTATRSRGISACAMSVFIVTAAPS